MYKDLITEINSKLLKDMTVFDGFTSFLLKNIYLIFKEELLGQND
jgi:hypothetical protein